MLSVLLVSVVLSQAPRSHVLNLDQPQDIRTKLHSQVTTYTLSADHFAEALLKIASQFDLTMGVEWIRSSETTRKIDLSWKNVSVQQILDAVMEGQPGYRLEISQGVVHVFPETMRSSSQDFLNARIERFVVHDQIVEAASHRLRDLVRQRAPAPQSQSQRPAGIGYSQGANVGDPKFSLALRDVTVRDVLDRLALASDRKIWIVTFTADATITPMGYHRTATLWNSNTIPDAEQPVWDMFRWSDSIP